MATVKGTWVFNDIVNKPTSSALTTEVAVNFKTSNGVAWSYMTPNWANISVRLKNANNGEVSAYLYNTNSWNPASYKTITFTEEQEVSDEFYNWFTANANPYVPPITFDLSTLGLTTGTHSITVKARGTGYIASPASNAVEYTA